MDDRLRKAARAAQYGIFEDQVRLVSEKLRSGEIPFEYVEAAAKIGHPVAIAIVGPIYGQVRVDLYDLKERRKIVEAFQYWPWIRYLLYESFNFLPLIPKGRYRTQTRNILRSIEKRIINLDEVHFQYHLPDHIEGNVRAPIESMLNRLAEGPMRIHPADTYQMNNTTANRCDLLGETFAGGSVLENKTRKQFEREFLILADYALGLR